MSSVGQSRAMLLLLVKLEEEVGAVYALCARRFPDHADFWMRLADEERRHADLLTSLVPAVEHGTIRASERAIDSNVLQVFFEYLHKQRVFVEQHDLSLLDAVEIALNVETTIVERKYFTYFAGDAPELATVVGSLETETDKHVEYLTALKETLASAQDNQAA